MVDWDEKATDGTAVITLRPRHPAGWCDAGGTRSDPGPRHAVARRLAGAGGLLVVDAPRLPVPLGELGRAAASVEGP